MGTRHVKKKKKLRLTGWKNEASRYETEVPGSVHFAHAVHVSRQGVLARALVRPWKAVDPLAPLQVAEHVGPAAETAAGRKGGMQWTAFLFVRRSTMYLEASHGKPSSTRIRQQFNSRSGEVSGSQGNRGPGTLAIRKGW